MNDTTALLAYMKLKFNIDHPSYEECYGFGYECGMNEIAEEDNPFKEGSSQYEQWQEGWWAGFYGEKPIFELLPLSLIEHPHAANDQDFHGSRYGMMMSVLKITGALAATALVGYQLLELVA